MSGLDRRKFLGSAAALVGAAGVTSGALSSAVAGDAKLPAASATPAHIDAANAQLGHTPHTRFAINLEMWWRNLPFLDRIRQAAALGFPAVEFWPYENKDIPAVGQLCRELNIKIAQFSAWSFEPGMNNPVNHEAVVKKITESCEVAKRLGVDTMCVVGGNDQPGMTQAQMHQNIITALKSVAPIAEKNKITLVLEPMNIRVDHKGHCLYGSPPALAICRAVNSPNVKILWDLYHMHISEGDLCGHLREGFDQLGYVQIADHPGRHEPGTGEVHYNRVLRELHELGYRGYVGVECVPTNELAGAKAVAAADVW